LEKISPEDGDRIQSPKSCLLNKNRTMDNVQKYNICIHNVAIVCSSTMLLDSNIISKKKIFISHKSIHVTNPG
jgi:hypothetical protein